MKLPISSRRFQNAVNKGAHFIIGKPFRLPNKEFIAYISFSNPLPQFYVKIVEYVKGQPPLLINTQYVNYGKTFTLPESGVQEFIIL